MEDPRAGRLIAATVQVCHGLDKQVIAEGVESLAQALRAQELDCDISQRFLFARALAPERMAELLEEAPTWLGKWPNKKASRSRRRTAPAGPKPSR